MCLDLISLLKLITTSPIKKHLKTEVSRNKMLQEQIYFITKINLRTLNVNADGPPTRHPACTAHVSHR